ncbi:MULTISPECIES: potassium-transporting ATPase subunit KdpC [Micrococcales]|uniref:Potassium-transporting ATPase KdpC subunit n=1 Tax=Knoellia koreensis TaxID=2730921 RepID=A0A849HK55_9MICO|nr:MULTISPECIES: potassium-transporting ATPase subunit KdpC [Micrococcales]NNM47043.1 potassium-transporting ATPase subunit KdpC [Knoellia sp. DB2414S]
MNTQARGVGRTIWVATRAMALLTLALGVGYTLLITGIGQLALPAQANGSIVTNQDGDPVGSALIGQSFTDEDGNPLPEYFQPRPSAAGDGYDGGASSGSNYGPENEDLIAAITERKAQVAEFNGVTEDEVPVDAVTASSSGLDPHISPEYAAIQIDRIADARGIPAEQLRELVAAHTQGPDAGYLGESRVNVLELNIAVDELEG